MKFCKKVKTRQPWKDVRISIFDGVVETMEFKNLADQVAKVAQGLHRTCTAERQDMSVETRSSHVDHKAPKSVF